MELKLIEITAEGNEGWWTFNQARMELKQAYLEPGNCFFETFNQARMELKPTFRTQKMSLNLFLSAS